MQNFLLEEGAEELTLRLEKGDRVYIGKQIIPVVKQFIENRAIFDKVVKKGISAELLSVIVRGDVAAVKAACDAAQVAGGRVGEMVAVHVIARPHANVDAVLPLGRKPAEAK